MCFRTHTSIPQSPTPVDIGKPSLLWHDHHCHCQWTLIWRREDLNTSATFVVEQRDLVTLCYNVIDVKLERNHVFSRRHHVNQALVGLLDKRKVLMRMMKMTT